MSRSQLVELSVWFMGRFSMMHETLASLETLMVRWLVTLYRLEPGCDAFRVLTAAEGGVSVLLMSQ